MNDLFEKKPLIILSGPTSVGKSALAVNLAKNINGEIISADSMQVYKGMDIGTAKITFDEMKDIPHHLIDILDPKDDFSVADFKYYAKNAISKIYENGHIPIVTGGTGFYVQALLYDVDFECSDGADNEYRKELENIALTKGADVLFSMLKEIDPKSAEIIHPNNVKRVIRAIEYFKETNQPISEHNELMHMKDSKYSYAYFVLNDLRERVYKNIDKRVDIMIENGLVEEVKMLVSQGLNNDYVSMHGLGYKEIINYLNGDISLDEAIYIIKRDTRHFAKKQITWFKREKDVIWVNKPDFDYNNDRILEFMKDKLYERNVL